MKQFIEIGTCDFDTCEQLAKNGWKGIMIEPAPIPYKAMAATVAEFPNITTLNIAISDHDGELEFGLPDYNSEGTWHWLRGIGSVLTASHRGTRMFDFFEKDAWYKSMGMTNFLNEVIKIPCLTLDTLIKQHSITHIDYLKLDVEGHELNIMDNYSWKIKPTIIKAEFKHSNRPYMKQLLGDLGYIVYKEKTDYYAIF